MEDGTVAAPAATPEAQPPTLPSIQDAMAAADVEAPLEAPAEEAAPAAEPPPPPEDTVHSQKLAELVRREQMVRGQQKSLKRQQEELQSQIEAGSKKAQEDHRAAMAAKIKEDPFGTLESEYGLDILSILGKIPGTDGEARKKDDRVASLESKLEALAKELRDERETKRAESTKEQTARVYGQALSSIHRVVAAEPEAFEAVLDQGQRGLQQVFTALDAMYQELVDQGYTPGAPSDEDIKTAARIVEEAERQREVAELQAKAQKRRFAGRLTFGEPSNAAQQPAKAQASAPKPPTTLTKGLQGTAPQKRELLTAKERMAAALLIPPPVGDEEEAS